jgi:hypothetical protein
MANLYKEVRKAHGAQFVRIASNSGFKTDIFGKTKSTLYQGAWKHNVVIEGNPIRNLGKPITFFSGSRVIVVGSEEEKNFYAAIKQKEEEKAAKFRKNLANAKSILVGIWQEQKSVITQGADGSFHLRHGSGNQDFGSWDVDGIFYVEYTDYRIYKDGTRENRNKTIRYKILHIDQNKYSMQSMESRKVYNGKRIK